jgi:hypothetical protein
MGRRHVHRPPQGLGLPFTITIATDGVAHLKTNPVEAWGLFHYPSAETAGAMVYEVKTGQKSGLFATSLINREHRILAMAPATAN